LTKKLTLDSQRSYIRLDWKKAVKKMNREVNYFRDAG
jgi:hypothetical protein